MHIEVILRVWNSRQGAEQWRMPELRGSRKNHPWGQKGGQYFWKSTFVVGRCKSGEKEKQLNRVSN